MAGVALGCVSLAAAGVVLLGKDSDFGSPTHYVASRKALKVALVEPAQQAQMEASTAIAAQPVAPDVKVKTAEISAREPVSKPATAPLAFVPLPMARPRQMAAATPLPRARVVEKAPELTAPVVVAAVETSVSTADLIGPSPQPSPRERGEEEEIVTRADAPGAAVTETKIETAENKPVPATFGPARPMPPFQLTSYAATREQIFDRDITGSIGNPLSDLDKLNALEPKPLANAVTPAKLAAVVPAKPVLRKPRVLTTQEKLWGSSVRLASLTPMDNVRSTGVPGGLPAMPYDRQTAVYVITDKKVYLPDGTELEAHSGLGPRMDDPRYVHIRMHGATPPHVYDLTMREALFHGVEAIRLTPMLGQNAIFGRDGLLAHSYLLGPNGQSNGCVSFKDYDAFLDAFKDGKITRLAVIAQLD